MTPVLLMMHFEIGHGTAELALNASISPVLQAKVVAFKN
jgi:hypothetical protein